MLWQTRRPAAMRPLHLPTILCLAACSAATPAPAPQTVASRPSAPPPTVASSGDGPAECAGHRGGMTIEGMLGTLPQPRVHAALRDAEARLTACYTQRLEAIPCLSGRVGFKIRVGVDGAVRWAIPTTSTMGDRETERCMQQELSHLDFGRPCGGEAEVTWSMELDGGPDARPATVWPASRLDAIVRQRRAALAACRHGSTAALSVTLYAAPNGSSVAAAGASIPDPQAEAAAECVLREVRGWRVPSPGSWYARATVTIP